MKKTCTCLLAILWLNTAQSQQVNQHTLGPQKSKQIQRIIPLASVENRSVENEIRELLNPGKNQEFRKVKTKKHDKNQVLTEVYQLYYQGIRVVGNEIRIIHQNGKPRYVFQEGEPLDTPPSLRPKLNAQTALNTFLDKTPNTRYAWQEPKQEQALKRVKNDTDATYYPKPELVFLPQFASLAYTFDLVATEPMARERVYVSAQTGALLKKDDLLSRELPLNPAESQPSQQEPATLGLSPAMAWVDVLGETKTVAAAKDAQTGRYYLHDLSSKTHTQAIGGLYGGVPVEPITEFVSNQEYQGFGDYTGLNGADAYKEATKVHFALQNINTYFQLNYSRTGFDGTASPLNAYVYQYKLGSAFYNREQALFFPFDPGLYDSEIKLSPRLQTVYHEFAHAFTVSESGLVGGSSESGSLNEALSDIWAYTVADNYLIHHPSNNFDPSIYNSLFGNTWVSASGNDAFQEYFFNKKGYTVVRDAQNPNSRKYPDFYQGVYWDPNFRDEHLNSTVVSHWYYLLATGGTVSTENNPAVPITITGIGIQKSADIVYLVTTQLLNSNTDFRGFALQTLLAASILYGENSPECTALINAWEAVGISQLTTAEASPCSPPPSHQTPYFLQSFNLANIQTTKPKNFHSGYADYRFLTIEAKPGYEYTIELSASGIEKLPEKLFWSIWIDLDGNGSYEVSERVLGSSGSFVKKTIKMPALTQGTRSTMRIVLSADVNTGPCYNRVANKTPQYIEDYSIQLMDYCAAYPWTNTMFSKEHPQFVGLFFDTIKLVECGNTPVFDLHPLAQQQSIDQTHKTLIGGKAYSLSFTFKPTEGVDITPNQVSNASNTFLSNCATQAPFGFSLGDINEENPLSEDGYTIGQPCPLARDKTEDFARCPSRLKLYVWLDFNRNGVLETNEKYACVYDFVAKNFYTNFEVPNWASTLSGKTAIRIYAYLGNGALYGGNACGNGINGLQKLFSGDPVLSKNAIDIYIGVQKQAFVLKVIPPKVSPQNEAISKEISPNPVLSLYPNPAASLVHITLNGPDQNGFTLSLYSLNTMHLISETRWNGNSLDISPYPNGLYLLVLKRRGETYSQRLLINR